MDVYVGTVRMVDQAMVDDVGALLKTDIRLRMDPEMKGIEVVHAVTEALVHFLQKPMQRVRLFAAVDFGDLTIFDG